MVVQRLGEWGVGGVKSGKLRQEANTLKYYVTQSHIEITPHSHNALITHTYCHTIRKTKKNNQGTIGK